MRTLPPFVHLRRTTHLAGESSFALVVLCVWVGGRDSGCLYSEESRLSYSNSKL